MRTTPSVVVAAALLPLCTPLVPLVHRSPPRVATARSTYDGDSSPPSTPTRPDAVRSSSSSSSSLDGYELSPPPESDINLHLYERSIFARVPALARKIQDSNEYKENSRLFRRTVFSDTDWIQFRSSERIYDNLASMFTNGVVGALWLEIGSVCFVSLIVYFINLAILSGAAQPLLAPELSNLLSLPTLPFQLSSPALALLLVFRNNAVYTRWMQARMSWERIQGQCSNTCRQGMAYLANYTDKEEHARRVIALAHVLKRHFRNEDDRREDEVLRMKLREVLGADECERLMAASNRPFAALTDISRLVRRTNRLDGSTRSRLDGHLDDLTATFVSCDCLRQTPVPLEYTRHTERFLGLWVLLLPLALTRELKGSFEMVPMSTLIALFLFGIEELGKEMEEPFSILPLEHWARRIERDALQMLEHEAAYPAGDIDPKAMLMESSGDPRIGSDAAPLFEAEGP